MKIKKQNSFDNIFVRLQIYHHFLPKSSESHVDVSVPVTFVANVDADSVDVLIVVSAVDATDVPITITYVFRMIINYTFI